MKLKEIGTKEVSNENYILSLQDIIWPVDE